MLNNNRQNLTTPPADGIRQPHLLPRNVNGLVARERPNGRPPVKFAASAPVLDTPVVPGLRIVSTAKKWWRSRGAGQTATTTAHMNNVVNASPVTAAPRRRRRMEREWPDVGTVLTETTTARPTAPKSSKRGSRSRAESNSAS